MRLQVIKALSRLLRQAMADHAAAYPDGDWKSVNCRLGDIRLILQALLPQTIAMSNADTLSVLEAEEQREGAA